MNTKIHKWFWVWDFEKEEAWLNDMSSRGFLLINVNFITYTFEAIHSEEYTYHLELLENLPTHQNSKKYLSFLKETGIDCVGSHMCWVYLRKEKNKGTFNLYSDYNSRISHFNRILRLLIVIVLIELVIIPFNFGILFNLNKTIIWDGRILIGSLTFIFALLAGYGALQINKRIKTLKIERELFEA